MKPLAHSLAFTMVLATALAHAATFTAPLPPSSNWSYATALSADGSTLIGIYDSGPYERNFYWTAAGGTTLIPSPTGSYSSYLHALSADGSVVTFNTSYFPQDLYVSHLWSPSTGLTPLALGDAKTNGAGALSADGKFAAGAVNYGRRGEAARWNQSGDLQLLGVLPGWTSSYAITVSYDGNVIGGVSNSGDSGEAFRWTPATGMQPLGFLNPTDQLSAVYAVSADGSTLAGTSGSEDANLGVPFRWSQSTGLVPLSDIAARPQFISTDGSVIVGDIYRPTGPGSAARNSLFRWTEATGFVDLGHPSDGAAFATGMSADGSIIVGNRGSDSTNLGAFIWDETHGMRSLADYFASLGLDLTGWQKLDVIGISSDGLTIAGHGLLNGKRQPWIATVPEPSVALLLLALALSLAQRHGARPH